MAKRKKTEPAPPPPAPPKAEDLGLESFETPADDMGLSLDELSQTYAALMGGGEDPYQPAPPPEGAVSDELQLGLENLADEPDDDRELDDDLPERPAVDNCEITPRSILEAMLFVGHPGSEPLESQNVAALMRGVTAQEIDELVQELNEGYQADGSPYIVESLGAGYRLALRPELAAVREKFFGRVKEARLSQANIDVLAIVAYNQPVSRPEVDKLRGRPSGGVLSQLVRRELIRIDRLVDNPRMIIYYTTDRFLDLYGLESLDDLPRTSDSDRGL